MSWLHAVHGKSFTFAGELTELNHDGTYTALVQKAESLGLLLEEQYDSDRDKHTVFIGYELHKDRHLYQGQTITCPVDPTKQVPAEIVAEVRAWLGRHKVSGIVEADGLILSQFD